MPELAPGIERNPDAQSGEACVAGTRVPVPRIGDVAAERGSTPAEIADRFDVSLGDVHRALAYVYDHPDEDGTVRPARRQPRT